MTLDGSLQDRFMKRFVMRDVPLKLHRWRLKTEWVYIKLFYQEDRKTHGGNVGVVDYMWFQRLKIINKANLPAKEYVEKTHKRRGNTYLEQTVL